jgi:hypothetical protein
VILFLCLVGRSYCGVAGVLAGIFALVFSHFCGSMPCNMSFRDVKTQEIWLYKQRNQVTRRKRG